MNLLKAINELGLLTEDEIKRLEKRIENNPEIRDKVGGLYEDYRLYIGCIEGVGNILPVLKHYAQILKKEFEI